MAFDLIPKDSSLIDFSSSKSALNKYEKDNRLYRASEKQQSNKDLINAAIDYKADYYNTAAWNDSLAELQKQRESFIDLYGQFYKSGSYSNTNGNVKSNLNPLEAADRKEFAEYLHDLYPAYSVDYFYRNAESFMKQATGVDTNIKSYWDHIGNVWNSSWANFALGWETFANYIGYGVSGQFGTQAWENKKAEMAEHRKYSASNYRKDLGDDVYDFLLAKMLSGTVEQAPQIASMLAQMALTGGVGGISGYLATKGVISKAAATTAAKIATSAGKSLTFALSMIGDGGSVMADCTEYGFSDETATRAGFVVGLFTGYIETWGDEQLLRPLNDFVDHLLKVDPNGQIVHAAVKSFGERLKEGGAKWAKHVVASEITEPIQEEVEYFSELFVKCLANAYEKSQGRGVDNAEIGATREQIWENVKDTLVQTMLSTPLMTLSGLAVSSGLDTILGGNVSQNAPRKYQNKEGATDVVSASNVVLSGIKVDETLKDADNGKANPIKAHMVGSHFVIDEAITKKQNDLLQSGRAIYITQADNSKLMKSSATVANKESIDSGVTLTREVADSYLVTLDLSGKLESYGFEEGRDFWGNIENKVNPKSLVEINHGEAINLFVKIAGQESPIKIAIGEELSSTSALSALQNLTGVKYEDFQTAEAREQDVQQRAEDIRAQEVDDEEVSAPEPDTTNTPDTTTPDTDEDDFDPNEGTIASATQPINLEEQALRKLNDEKPEPVRKKVSYKAFNFREIKRNKSSYSVEMYSDSGEVTNDFDSTKIVGIAFDSGKRTYVDVSKINDAKKREILTLSKNNPLGTESTQATKDSIVEDNKRTDSAKEAVGIESTPAKVETVASRDQKAKETTESAPATPSSETANAENNTVSEQKTEPKGESKTETTEEAKSESQEEAKTEAKPANTPEPVKEREFNVSVEEVKKETKATHEEAQDAVLATTAMKETVEQATGKKKSLSDVLKKINTKKFVKNLAESNSPQERASVVAKAITNIDGFESILQSVYGKDVVLNEATKETFVNDFVNYINGTAENLTDNAITVFDKLTSGVLATYLNDVQQDTAAIKKLKDEAPEPKTIQETAEDVSKHEEERVKQELKEDNEAKAEAQKTETTETEAKTEATEAKTEAKETADTKPKQTLQEWFNSASRAQQIAYNLAFNAYEYYSRQAKLQSGENERVAKENLRDIYKNWAFQIGFGDINTAYEYLASYDNLYFERAAVANNTWFDESGKERMLGLPKNYKANKYDALLSDEAIDYYMNKKGLIATFGELNTMAVFAYSMGKMNAALDDGLNKYFQDILQQITTSDGGILKSDDLKTADSINNPELYRLAVMSSLNKNIGEEKTSAVINTILTELDKLDMANLKERNDILVNNSAIRQAYTSLISSLLLSDFLSKFPEGSKLSIIKMFKCINDWNKLSRQLTDKYADMSLLKSWQTQEEVIATYTKELEKQREENKKDRLAEERSVYSQDSLYTQPREGTDSDSYFIASSYRFDTDKGKYYITDGVQKEVFQVVSATMPNATDEQLSDLRKTAVFATAFLTSLDEDIQDELVRKSLRHNGTDFLTGGNENMLRLFFNFNDLTPEAQKTVSDKAIGASLTESAKIILGAHSNESTIVHESGHIIYNLDSDFRDRAKTEYAKYFEHDSAGNEIRAVVEASPERFGGMSADEVIENLRNITRDDYDYSKEEFHNTEEAIMYMFEAYHEGRDKIQYSEGLRGLFERLAQLMKTALEKLARIFNTDFLHETNNKIYAPLFENEADARQFFADLKAQNAEELTLPMRANTKPIAFSTDGSTMVAERDGTMVITRGTGSNGIADAFANDGKMPMVSIALTVPNKVPFYNSVHGGVIFIGGKEQAERYMQNGWAYDRDLASGHYPEVAKTRAGDINIADSIELMEDLVARLDESLEIPLDLFSYPWMTYQDRKMYSYDAYNGVTYTRYLEDVIASYESGSYKSKFSEIRGIKKDPLNPFLSAYESALYEQSDLSINGLSPKMNRLISDMFKESGITRYVSLDYVGYWLNSFVETNAIDTTNIEKWSRDPSYSILLEKIFDNLYKARPELFNEDFGIQLLSDCVKNRLRASKLSEQIESEIKSFKNSLPRHASQKFFKETKKPVTPENALEIMMGRDNFTVSGLTYMDADTMVKYTAASKIQSLDEAHANEWKYTYTDKYSGIGAGEITGSLQWKKASQAWQDFFDAVPLVGGSYSHIDHALIDVIKDWFRDYSKTGKRDYEGLRNKLLKDYFSPSSNLMWQWQNEEEADRYVSLIKNAIELSEVVPTEYGEIKPAEMVNIRDFSGAISLQGTDPTVTKELREKYGLEVLSVDELIAEGKYDPNEEDALHKLIARYVNSAIGVKNRMAFQTVADSLKDSTKNRDDYQSRQQFEELTYVHILNDEGGNEIVKNWRKGLNDTFASPSDISRLRGELQNGGFFHELDRQNVSAPAMEEMKKNVAERIAYSGEDYLTFAKTLGKLKDKLIDKDGRLVEKGSTAYNNAMYRLYGYRDVEENGITVHKPVGIISKMVLNDKKSRFGTYGTNSGHFETTIKETLNNALKEAGFKMSGEDTASFFNKKLAMYSNTETNKNVKTGAEDKKLVFNTNISTAMLRAFLSALVEKQGDSYVPRVWKSGEGVVGFGNYIQGPLVDILNDAHLDESAVSGFSRNTLTNSNDMFIKAAYNNYNSSVKDKIGSSIYLADSVTKDLLGAIKLVGDKGMLHNLYGMKMNAEFYERLGKDFQTYLEQHQANEQVLNSVKESWDNIDMTSPDAIVDEINKGLKKLEKSVKEVEKDKKKLEGLKDSLRETKNELSRALRDISKLRDQRLEEIEKANKYLEDLKDVRGENKELQKKLSASTNEIKKLTNKFEKKISEAFVSLSQSDIEKISSDGDVQKILNAYQNVLSTLKEERREFKEKYEKAEADLKQALDATQLGVKVARAALSDFTEAGVVPLFSAVISKMKESVKKGGTAKVSEKLSALMDLIGTKVPAGKIRTLNKREVFNYRTIYTSNISPNYEEYRSHVDDLRRWVIDNMLAPTENPDIATVVKTVWDLNAEQLVQLNDLIKQVNKDSVKYYKESVQVEEDYIKEWFKNIVAELNKYAKIKGKNFNELVREDSLGTNDSVTKFSKVGEFLDGFRLESSKYREKFPTLYAFIYGGEDHQGKLWEGLNGNYNDLDREVDKRYTALNKLLIDNLSETIFHKGKLTEKNLRREMETVKNSFKTTLQEDVLTDADYASVGFNVDEYIQDEKKKRVASVDEDSESALKNVIMFVAENERKIEENEQKIRDIEGYEDSNGKHVDGYIEKNEDKIASIDLTILNLQSQITILLGAPNIKNGGTLLEEDRKIQIKTLEDKIQNKRAEQDRIRQTNENYREKLYKLYEDNAVLAQIGNRPNENMAQYTTQELLGIYMDVRQDEGINHLLYHPTALTDTGEADVRSSITNNLSLGNIIWVIKQFEDPNGQFAPLKKVADGLSKIASEKFEQVRDTRYFMSNGEDWIEAKDYYFTFMSDGSETFSYGKELDLGIFDKPAEANPSSESRTASASDKMTKERSDNAMRALNLRVLDFAHSSIYKQEYYINMAKPIKNLKALVANQDFQSAMKQAFGRTNGIENLKSLGKYVNQLSNTQNNIDEHAIYKVVRFMTANTAVAAMAFRLSSVLQQFPTMLMVLREKHVGFGGMIKALHRAIVDTDTVFGYSPQMKEIAESSVAYIRQTRDLGTMFGKYTVSKAITVTQDVGLYLLDKANGYIANAMWYAYFEGVKQEYIEKGIGQSMTENEFMQLCANEATQRVLDVTPTQQAKDQAGVYASKNAFLKDLLLFTNQTTKMLNWMASPFTDGKKAKDMIAKTIAIALATFMLNALISGKLFEKSKDDDDDEAKINLLRNIPLSIISGAVDLIPIGGEWFSNDKYKVSSIPDDLTNLFKVLKKDKEKRTEHQLANAWANTLTDAAAMLGLPGTEMRSVYRAFRDGTNLGYVYNTNYGELFAKEDE